MCCPAFWSGKVFKEHIRKLKIETENSEWEIVECITSVAVRAIRQAVLMCVQVPEYVLK